MDGTIGQDVDKKPHTLNRLFDQAIESTNQVASRLEHEFEKSGLLDNLYKVLGSFIFNAAQKLIDAKSKTRVTVPQDDAIIISCSRLFNDCFAGYMLLNKGLVVPAIVLLRAAFEVTTQAVMFMENPNQAQLWLRGEKIQPRTVRSLCKFAESQKDWYKKLSSIAHPNYKASWLHMIPLEKGHASVALMYGGYFCPKTVGQLACQFIWLQLIFLKAFYTSYSRLLEQLELTWRRELVELFRETGQDAHLKAIGWHQVLDILAHMAEDLTNHYAAMPEDSEGLAASLAVVPGQSGTGTHAP